MKANIIAIRTIANDTLITIFMPVRSLNIVLKITKLIAKEIANIMIAKIRLRKNKLIIPITKKTFEMSAMSLIIFGLIVAHSFLTNSYMSILCINQIVPYLSQFEFMYDH